MSQNSAYRLAQRRLVTLDDEKRENGVDEANPQYNSRKQKNAGDSDRMVEQEELRPDDARGGDRREIAERDTMVGHVVQH